MLGNQISNSTVINSSTVTRSYINNSSSLLSLPIFKRNIYSSKKTETSLAYSENITTPDMAPISATTVFNPEYLAKDVNYHHIFKGINECSFKNSLNINNKFDDFNPFNKSSAELSRKLISNSLNSHISSLNYELCEPGEENSFFVCDLGEVMRLYSNWILKLPRVKPFYAVKCNNDPLLLNLLAKLGLGFDCASKNEIEKMLSIGVSQDRIIYAHPCKSSSFLRYAENNQISLTTVDNDEELTKISKYHPNCDILLRISTDDSTAQCPLSTKFGATLQECEFLLKKAKDLNLNVVGVSFHVGSGATDFSAIEKAIGDARFLFDEGSLLGFDMKLLDIGGGFSLDSFNQSSRAVNYSLDKFFSEESFPGLSIIAEPGRYFSATAFTLACNIIAKRNNMDGSSRIYLNDGCYGNLNCIIYDHQVCDPKVLTSKGIFVYEEISKNDISKFKQNFTNIDNSNKSKLQTASIWGPTCDGLDCISKETELSHDVEVGDWLYFENMGSYTSAASTSFNGFENSTKVKYVSSGDLPF